MNRKKKAKHKIQAILAGRRMWTRCPIQQVVPNRKKYNRKQKEKAHEEI